MSKEILDWKGRIVSEPESEEKPILVWCIDPGIVGYDQTWVRGYQRAIEIAHEVIESQMDSTDEENLIGDGCEITIKLVRTAVGEMKAIESQED